MKASDIMSSGVVSVRPETSAREIARLLLEKHISAVPVIDASGALLGMVSEGDLVGRDQTQREERRDWWLALLAEGETLSPEFLAGLRHRECTARDIMSGPVVTVEETADVTEIARLLTTYRIKRVPVMRDGQVIGIASRADLLRALAAEPPSRPAAPEGLLSSLLAGLDEHLLHRAHRSELDQAKLGREPSAADHVAAADFRALVADFQHEQTHRREELRRAAAERRRQQVAELIDLHATDESWRGLLHQARQAAEHGKKELMLLRFPNQLCSDGGRAINATDPDWPRTLRGEPAELYLRGERDLRPRGFHLAARVLEFPNGMPGDIGLFLIWGNRA